MAKSLPTALVCILLGVTNASRSMVSSVEDAPQTGSKMLQVKVEDPVKHQPNDRAFKDEQACEDFCEKRGKHCVERYSNQRKKRPWLCPKDAHNCRTKESWSREKKEWCCDVKQLGCPRHNCYTKESWSDEKKQWCCEHEKLGCAPEPSHNCYTKESWTDEKKKWCCEHEKLGCEKEWELICMGWYTGTNILDETPNVKTEDECKQWCVQHQDQCDVVTWHEGSSFCSPEHLDGPVSDDKCLPSRSVKCLHMKTAEADQLIQVGAADDKSKQEGPDVALLGDLANIAAVFNSCFNDCADEIDRRQFPSEYMFCKHCSTLRSAVKKLIA